MLTVSVIVVSTVGGAMLFVPKFRDGVSCLGERVSGALGSRAAGSGCTPSGDGAGEPGTAAEGDSDGELPPLPDDPLADPDNQAIVKCSGPNESGCVGVENMNQGGVGADDECWAVAMAQVSGFTKEEVADMCDNLREMQNIATKSNGIVYSGVAKSKYMDQESMGTCLGRLGVEASVTTVDQCPAGSQMIALFEWDPAEKKVVKDGPMGHHMPCTVKGESYRCFDSASGEEIVVSRADAEESMAVHESKVVCAAAAGT